MRRESICAGTLTLTLFLTTAVSALAGTPAHLWSRGFGGTNGAGGRSVAVDGSGNVIMTGYFYGTVNFGGADLTSAGAAEIFLAKFSANGVHQWSQRFGSTSHDQGNSVAVDGSGAVILTGIFAGTVNFGGSNLTSAGDYDIFVAKYNANGVHQWSRRVGGTDSDDCQSVAVDGSGNVLATGGFYGTASFGGGNLTSAGLGDIFVAKYNASGVYQWSRRFGGTGEDMCYSVAVDKAGGLVLTGGFFGVVNFGLSDLTSAGGADIFLAKYSASGTHQWSQRFGSTSTDVGNSVAVDESGNVVATGPFMGTVNFGGGGLVSAGSHDIFMAKYNVHGVHQWSQRFGSTDFDIGYSVAVDESGDVVATGQFRNTVDFGGGGRVSAGGNDIYIAKYSRDGVHRWSQGFGGVDLDEGWAVTMDKSANVVATGLFHGTVNFGGGDLTASAGAAFVAKFDANSREPMITSIADMGNDQGRQVKIRFNRSGLDVVSSSTPILRYDAFRRDDAAPPASGGPAESTDRATLAEGWTQVGSVAAYGDDSYGIDVPTVGDSTLAYGQYYSAFFIRAGTAEPTIFYESAPDSGYSLDNLAPGVPTSFAYSAGVLSWDESAAGDFDYFSVYGANTNSFAVATLVDYCVPATMDVTASPYVFYFVTATDFSGNEGKPAVVNTLSGVGGRPKSYVLSVSAYPNPFNPATTIRYTVPSKGRVRLGVYDVRGTRVVALIDEEKEAGAHTSAWDGRDAGDRAVGSGVYFLRISHPSGEMSRKIVMLK